MADAGMPMPALGFGMPMPTYANIQDYTDARIHQ
jgi:hypothetical protein